MGTTLDRRQHRCGSSAGAVLAPRKPYLRAVIARRIGSGNVAAPLRDDLPGCDRVLLSRVAHDAGQTKRETG